MQTRLRHHRFCAFLILGSTFALACLLGACTSVIPPSPPSSIEEAPGQPANNSLEARLDAIWALGEPGNASPDVVSALAAATRDTEPSVRVVAAHALGKLGATGKVLDLLTNLLQDSNADVRYSAARALGNLDGAASDASHDLLMTMAADEDGDVRWAAADALRRIGLEPSDAALATVIDALDDPSWYVRAAAASLLASTEGAETEMIRTLDAGNTNWALRNAILAAASQMPDQMADALLPAVSDSSTQPIMRSLHMLAFLEMGELPNEAAIFDALVRSSDDMVQRAGVSAMGSRGMPYLPALIELALGDDESARSDAIAAVAHTEPAAAAHGVILLTSALTDTNPVRAARAIDALGALGAPAERAEPVLLSLATDAADDRVRIAAINALSSTAVDTTHALSVLLTIALRADLAPVERTAALRSIGHFGEKAISAVDPLAELLNDLEPEVQIEAMHALSAIGARDPEVIERIAGIAADAGRVEALRVAAVDHFSRTGITASPVISQLVAVLDAVQPQSLRVQAARALGRMGPVADLAMPAINALLNDADPVVADAAAQALGDMAPRSMPLLMERLRSPDSLEHERAFAAIRAAGVSAVPGLAYALNTEDREVRLRIIQALDAIGPTAILGLWTAMNDSDEQVRTTAEAIFAARFDEHKQRGGSVTPVVTNGFAVKEAIPFLLAALQSGDEETMQQSASALALIGPAAADAAPFVGLAAAGSNEQMQCSAALTLLLIGGDGAAAAPYLTDALSRIGRDSTCTVDKGTRRLLQASPHAKALADVVALSRLNQGEVDRRIIIIETLAQYGEQADAAAPMLAALLHEESLRIYAAQALSAVGAAAIPVLDGVLAGDGAERPAAVEDALDGKGRDLRRSAFYALALMNELPAEVTTMLRQTAANETEDIDIRSMAAAALEEHGQDMTAFWQAHDRTNPTIQTCAQSVASSLSAEPARELYWGSCRYGPAPEAPPIVRLFRAIVNFFRRR